MEASIKSGYYYANNIARISLQAFEAVMGKNGLNAILNLAGLPHLIDNYPPDNLEREFDFEDFSAIQQALEQMYGSRGGRNLALRAGRAVFPAALQTFGALAGVSDLAHRVLDLQTKLRIGLPAMALVFTQFSDQHTTVEERDADFLFTIHRCPICWGRRDADKPVCAIVTGLLLEGVSWIASGYEFPIYEKRCVAKGDAVCDFIIEKNPIS